MEPKENVSAPDSYLDKAKNILRNITVEPLMFLDGLAYSIMIVYVEDLQMRRICEVGLGQNSSVCSDLPNNPEISNKVQLDFSVFAFYDGIIKSAIPLFFILFMGAWSDKYGRKVPLYTVQIGHLLNFIGLLLFSLVKTWPVEYMLIPTFLDSLGGGNVCFLTAANAYISDITSESSRTSRVGLANSIYFLGGPIGTFTGKFLYDYGGYSSIFGTALTMTVMSLLYLMLNIQESHGPYASKKVQKMEKKDLSLRESLAQLYGIEHEKQKYAVTDKDDITLRKMVGDFFNPRRIIESFKCTLQKREGNTRVLILLVIFCSLLRRLTRSPYVFAFSRHALSWEAGDYSLWVTFKNLMATVGSLVAVPFLSGHLHVSDYFLGMIGAMSSMLEYLSYGIVVFIGEFFFWIAPIFALLINACTIAQRAMLSKFVTSDELGKVSAVLGALDGIMPMTNFALFMAVYRQTVTTFPAAHFFLAAACSALMVLVFFLIMALDRSRQYDIENVKKAVSSKIGPIISKTFLVRNDSRWLSTDFVSMSITTSLFEEQNGTKKPAFPQDAKLSPTGKNCLLTDILPSSSTLRDSEDEESKSELETISSSEGGVDNDVDISDETSDFHEVQLRQEESEGGKTAENSDKKTCC